MSKKKRQRSKRRDRRKAKASGWKRMGKQMGARVAHGSSNPVNIILNRREERLDSQEITERLMRGVRR